MAPVLNRPRPIPVYAEMGTVNPVVVTSAGIEDADAVAAGFVGSFTLGSGQFCTKPGLLLAPAGHDLASRVAEALVVAPPALTTLTPTIATGVSAALAELEVRRRDDGRPGPRRRDAAWPCLPPPRC